MDLWSEGRQGGPEAYCLLQFMPHEHDAIRTAIP